jgi:hypothetical protein
LTPEGGELAGSRLIHPVKLRNSREPAQVLAARTAIRQIAAMPRIAAQPDLFADPGRDMTDPMEQAFIDGIREELLTTLALARDAAVLPWPNLTRATLAELHFNSVARYLPNAEAERLRGEFAVEIARLWAVEEAKEGVPAN